MCHPCPRTPVTYVPGPYTPEYRERGQKRLTVLGLIDSLVRGRSRRGKPAMARGDLAKAAEEFSRSLAQARALSMRPVCEACEAELAAIAALQSEDSVQRNVEV